MTKPTDRNQNRASVRCATGIRPYNGSAWVRNKMGEDGDPAMTVFVVGQNGFDVQSFSLL